MRHFMLICIVMIVSRWSISVGQNQQTVFLYTIDDELNDVSSLCWFTLNDSSTEGCMSVPTIGMYAVSPDGLFIAIRGEMNGEIYVVDLTKQQVTSLGLCQPLQEFLWDEQYHISGTLLWSPNARFLAFTGVESDSSCTVADSSNLYLYDIQTDQLVNLTNDISVLRSLIIPASWSPDGMWLALYGAWSEYENEQGYIVPDWGSAIISLDGSTFIELAPGYNTCRLLWSPNMEWLASNTTCFDASGTGSSVIVIPFNPVPLIADGLRIDEVISPLRFDWRADSSWISTYSVPEWIDASTLIVHRQLVPISFGHLSDELLDEFSVKGLIEIDLDTFSETLLPSTHFAETTYRIDKWFVAQDKETGSITAFDPHTNREFTIPESIKSCPISYALKIERYGDFIALLNACESPTTMPAIDIYNTTDFSLIWSRQETETHTLRPIGFFQSSR